MNTYPAQSVICICSLHPLAMQSMVDAIANVPALEVKIRTSSTFHELHPEEQGELLLLDGCCDDWPKPAFRWQKSGGQVLALLSTRAAHPRKQLQALFLGVMGVVVISRNWQAEIRQAVKGVLEGKRWVSREILNEYLKRVSWLDRGRSRDFDSLTQLTAREEQIMTLLLKGDSNKEIADVFGIAERTVKYHVSNILQKSQVSSRRQLARTVNGAEICGSQTSLSMVAREASLS